MVIYLLYTILQLYHGDLSTKQYFSWTNRQKRAINIPTMDEEKQGQSIDDHTEKGNQYTYDG